MVAHHRRLKTITLDLDGIDVECQVIEARFNPPQNIGDKRYTLCPDGEFREDVDDDDWTMDLRWLTDWRVGGLNRHLEDNRGETVTFTYVENADVTGEKVQRTGQVILQVPPAGGEARVTQESEITLTGVGTWPTPTYPA